MDSFFQWPEDDTIGALVRGVNESYKNPTSCRPQRLQALNCPRCKSSNTKFCYYNNYSVSQPRYLCKTCKRYWTEGGILRNVPMGGGSRKTKKPQKKVIIISSPMQVHETSSLNSDFNDPFVISDGMSGEFFELNNHQSSNNFCCSSFSVSDNSFVSMPSVHDSSSAFSSSGFYDYNNMMDHDVKPSSSFSYDGLEFNGCGNNLQGENISSSSRIIFPFDDELNPVTTCDYDQLDSSRCWIGMVNGGSSQLDVGLEWSML